MGGDIGGTPRLTHTSSSFLPSRLGGRNSRLVMVLGGLIYHLISSTCCFVKNPRFVALKKYSLTGTGVSSLSRQPFGLVYDFRPSKTSYPQFCIKLTLQTTEYRGQLVPQVSYFLSAILMKDKLMESFQKVYTNTWNSGEQFKAYFQGCNATLDL